MYNQKNNIGFLLWKTLRLYNFIVFYQENRNIYKHSRQEVYMCTAGHKLLTFTVVMKCADIGPIGQFFFWKPQRECKATK